jgi:hypothetical protein
MSFILFLILSAQSSFAKTDLKGFAESAKSAPRKTVVEKTAPLKTKKESAQIKDPQLTQDVNKMRESLKGVNLVLNNQPKAPNRIELLLKKAFLHVSIVRELGRSRTSATQLTDEDNKHLTIAKEILNKLLQPSARLPEDKKSSVYYLLGLTAYEYENYKLQQKYFIDALKIDPKGQRSGSLALMVAEQYFDEEDFENALKYYNGFTAAMTDRQKDLALYKSAWCYISTKDMEKAENELLKVVQSNRQSGFQKDSLRDLAYIAVRHRDELGIIRYGQQKIVSDADRNEFYSLSLKYFFQMQTHLPLNRLISLVLKSEKKLEVRLDILGHQVNEYRRDYMNPQVLSYFQGIRLELEKNKTNLDIAELSTFKKNFQVDMEYFIYNVTQVYQAKVETEKAIPRAKVAYLLEKDILFYDYFFPESKNKILVYQILSDLCVDSKVYACVTQVYNKISNYKPEDKGWNDLRLKLRVNQLLFTDEMYIKEPEKNEVLMLQVFNDFKKDYPDHDLVLKGLKKTLQIYIKKSDTPNIERSYAEIFQKEKTPENLYNWSLIVFKQDKFAEVVPMIKEQFPADAKLNQLRIETYLKLAEKESRSNNFKSYEAYIIEILKISKDPEKVALIYSDWLQQSFNIKPGGTEHAAEIFNSIPLDIRSKSLFDPFTTRLAASFVVLGDFERLWKLDLNRGAEANKKDHNLTYYKLVNFFARKEAALPDWVNQMQTLDTEKRTYLLGLLVLLKPNMALDYFRKTKVTEANTPELYLLALKMQHQSDIFNLTPTDKKILGALADSVKKNSNDSPALLEEIRQVKFPTAKMNSKKYNAVVEVLVPSVKKIREKILKSFADSSIEQKLLIVPEAETLEARTAKAIEEAPLPSGLDELQKAEYQSGINELAKEFVDQSIEYKKMFNGLSEKMIEITKLRAAELLPEINMTKWIWPDTDIAKKALTLQSTANIQAFFYLDAQISEKAISEADYTTTRVGLLALSQNSEVMRDYIKQELEQQKNEELLKKWRSLK